MFCGNLFIQITISILTTKGIDFPSSSVGKRTLDNSFLGLLPTRNAQQGSGLLSSGPLAGSLQLQPAAAAAQAQSSSSRASSLEPQPRIPRKRRRRLAAGRGLHCESAAGAVLVGRKGIHSLNTVRKFKN